MSSAAERLQEASHKVAEAMYRGATTGAGAGASSADSGASAQGSGSTPTGGGGAGKEDEVIDTEYVDTEKS